MGIAYGTTYDASEVRHYSGTGHSTARALEAQGAEVVYLGGLQERGKRRLQAVQLWHRLGLCNERLLSRNVAGRRVMDLLKTVLPR